MLAKINRLSKNKDFDYVFKRGKSSYNKIIGVKSAANQLEQNRIGIIISNKVSKKAVARHKISRQLRAIIRSQFGKMKSGYDIVIVVRPVIINKPFTEIEQAITDHFRQLKLYK